MAEGMGAPARALRVRPRYALAHHQHTLVESKKWAAVVSSPSRGGTALLRGLTSRVNARRGKFITINGVLSKPWIDDVIDFAIFF